MYISIAEFEEEWSHETALTMKVMNIITDASLQQLVSPNGRTLGGIAWHIIVNIPEYLSHFGLAISAVDHVDAIPCSALQISKSFREVSVKAAATIQEQWTDESLTRSQNAFGRNLSNAAILSLMIKHMIHHRGQMTVLMRQAELSVPGMYGPSKEEWGRIGQVPPAI